MSADRFRDRKTPARTALVIGLGRFGIACARSLIDSRVEVLAVDESADRVQRFSDEFTHVVQADATDEDALRQLDVATFDTAIVAIGNDIEASVMTVLALHDVGVRDIWAKAITRKHGRILERVGATHVVYPERAMGERVAHAVSGSMIDYFGFEDGFAIARTLAPKMAWDKPLSESVIRSKFHVSVVGLKRSGEDFTYALPETVVLAGDELIVSGATEVVEAFCRLA